MADKGLSLDYRRLLEMAPGAFAVILPDMTIAAATDEYLRLTMRKREEVVGHHVFEAFPDNPKDEAHNSEAVRASFEKVFETGEPDELPVQKYDIPRPAEEGGGFEERYWRIVTYPGFDKEGNVAYIYPQVENITEQILLEKRNREREEKFAELEVRAEKPDARRKEAAGKLEDIRLRLETALDAGEIGTWIWDPIENKVFSDKNFAKFHQVSNADEHGGAIEKYLAVVHPADVLEIQNLIEEVLDHKDFFEIEYRVVNPDNSIRWISARGSVIRNEQDKAIQIPGVAIDITNRKKNEVALQETQQRLALALQAGRAGTFVWDIKNSVNVWSPELEELYGIPVGSFEGDYESWAKRVVPEDAEKVSKGIEKSLEKRAQFYDYEFRAILPDGKHRWFYGRARLEYDADDKPLSMLGINIDITRYKRAQEQLLERTELATLSSDIGIAVNRPEDLRSLLKYCTDAFVNHMDVAFARIWMLDKKSRILKLQASSGLYTHIDGPHSRIPVGKYKIGKIAEEREPHLTNEVMNDPRVSDKEWAKREGMIAFAGYPLIVEDKLVGVVGAFAKKRLTEAALQSMEAVANTIANAIERKQIEESLSESIERFQLVTSATNDAIWDWNLKTDEVWWNESIQTMFGFKPEQVEPTADWWYKNIHPEDRKRIFSGIHEVIDGGGERWSDEYRFRCADSSYKFVLDRGFIVHRNGKPFRMIGAMQDVTESKLIETEREKLLLSEKNARAEAEEANRLKDEFLATLSHELRTPLSSILGWSRLLKQGQIKEKEMGRAIETIERNAQIQAQLIEDVLDVSRIISGKMRLEVQPLDLTGIVESAIDSVRPAADAKEIQLQCTTDSEATISGDADRLQQIIWNLLSNAIKFTPKGGLVQVKMERVNSHVEIVVKDDGIGIEPETLPYVFDRFRQSDSSTKRKYGGLGLGLAIVRHLVELHGGTVEVSSKGLDKGTEFIVRFPIIPLRSKEIHLTDGGKDKPNVDGETAFVCPPEIKDLRILLVDDEKDTREMLLYIFETCGGLPKGAASVDEALEALKENKFDVLVSDVGMPERDGYDLIRGIRKLPPEQGGRIPAVALTAYARVEDRLRLLSSGFQMHVPKPVDPAELLAVVASLSKREKS